MRCPCASLSKLAIADVKGRGKKRNNSKVLQILFIWQYRNNNFRQNFRYLSVFFSFLESKRANWKFGGKTKEPFPSLVLISTRLSQNYFSSSYLYKCSMKTNHASFCLLVCFGNFLLAQKKRALYSLWVTFIFFSLLILSE